MRRTPERGAVAGPARTPHRSLLCIAPAEPPARSPDRGVTRLRGHSARAQADQRVLRPPVGSPGRRPDCRGSGQRFAEALTAAAGDLPTDVPGHARAPLAHSDSAGISRGQVRWAWTSLSAPPTIWVTLLPFASCSP